MKKNVTWIVLADHQHGRVLSNEGPGHALQPVADMSFVTKLHTDQELVADRLPRSINSSGAARHGIEPRIDPHRQEAERFVAKISSAVATAATESRFDQLVLIAPPRALGELRKFLPSKVREMVVGEIDSDLLHASIDTIREKVAEFIKA
jgi:protein required for attachment to host cells